MQRTISIESIPRVRPGEEIEVTEKSLSAIDSERLELGRKAAQLLGYRSLKSDVTGQVTIPIEEIGELGTALLSLDIDVLDAASVFRYQQEEVCARNTEFAIGQLKGNKLDQLVSWGWHYAQWERTKLSDYSEPIPEHVIHKAVQIKEKLPKVEFYVMHLSDPKADPFLLARVGKELYFIEVWDEPRFEGRVRR